MHFKAISESDVALYNVSCMRLRAIFEKGLESSQSFWTAASQTKYKEPAKPNFCEMTDGNTKWKKKEEEV